MSPNTSIKKLPNMKNCAGVCENSDGNQDVNVNERRHATSGEYSHVATAGSLDRPRNYCRAPLHLSNSQISPSRVSSRVANITGSMGRISLINHSNDEGGLERFTFLSASHNSSLAARVQTLYASGALCDVTLECEGRQFAAHRVILCACSDYFAAMFTMGLCETNQDMVDIQGIDSRALEALLQYCYSGQISLEESQVECVLSAACILQLHEVIEACSDFLQTQLDPANCLGIRNFADAQGCDALQRVAHTFTTNNFIEVIRNQEFLMLPSDEVFKLLSSDDLNVCGEMQVFTALCAWINHDIQSRGSLVGSLLPSVRLAFLSPAFIADNILKDNLFADDRLCQNLVSDAFQYHLLPERRANVTMRVKPRKSTVGKLYAVGGLDANRGAMTIEEYNLLKDKWVAVGEMSSRRVQFGVSVMNGKLYIAGGRDGLKTLNNFDCWDPHTNTWTSMTNMNSARHGLGVAVLSGPLYAVGGHDGWSYLNSAERYDPATKTWTDIAPMQSPRNTAGVVVLDGLLYSIGGRDSSQVLRCGECYNPHTNKWICIGNMNRRRSSMGVAVLHSCIYAVGGMDAPASNPNSNRFSCVERYDPKMNEWTLVASLSTGRDGVAACALGDLLFAVGGFNGHVYMKTVECYDSDTNEWREVADLKTGRSGTCVVAVGAQMVTSPIKANNASANRVTPKKHWEN